MSGSHLTAIDLATLAYVGLATIAVWHPFTGEAIAGRASLLAVHTLLGDWYPLLLLAGLYGEVHVLTVDAGFRNERSIQ